MFNIKRFVSQIYVSTAPLALLEARHHFKTRHAVQEWLADEYVFIHIPKSGGTSLALAHDRHESGHYCYQKILSMRNGRVGSGAYFIMRDPVERIISSYKYLNILNDKFGSSPVPAANKSKNIDDFLEKYIFKIDVNDHYFFRSASCFIRGAPRCSTWMINFENLSNNLKIFFSEVVGEQMVLPHVNSSAQRSDDVKIKEENIDILKEIYKDDMILCSTLSGKPFARVDDADLADGA
ncbi:hypothetical protein [Alloalcanivorax mobilis]|uniref:hypothetical protein n=1 Tax=Alloalcanivorax mobilis TaxID=2019569 RepID=UPI0012FFFBB2|nr:hypothetical protein [Alloalcanivorax mobilis]